MLIFNAEVSQASFKVVRSEDVVVRIVLDTEEADLNQLKEWRRQQVSLKVTIAPV